MHSVVRRLLVVGFGVLLFAGLTQAGELRIGIATEPWDLDPAIYTDTGSGYIIQNVYDPLIELGPDNEPTTEYAVCESWEFSEDATAITLHIRPGIKFHDGSDLTAQDVKYNFEWILDPENESPMRRVVGPVAELNILDDYTLEVVYEKPFPEALQYLARAFAGIVPEGAHGTRSPEKGIAGIAGTDLSRNPIGSGPFKFVEWVSGSHIVLERFDDYWAEGVPAPGIDRVVFEFIGDQAALMASLIAGRIHIVDKVTYRDYDFISRMPGIVTKRLPGIQEQYVALNLGSHPFGITADEVGDEQAIARALAARKFMMYAIDREEIRDEIFFGMATIMYGPWYPDSEWFSPRLRGRVLHDPELARQYLEEYYALGGERPLRFRIIATNAQWFVDVATLIQEQLRQYGVETEVIPVDKATFFDTLYETFDWEAGVEDWGYGNFSALYWMYAGYYRNHHNHNHWHHAAPDLPEHYHPTVPGHAEFCALYDEAIVEPDVQRRKELTWQMQEMLVENVVRIDLMIADNLYAWREEVVGYGDGLNSEGDINLRYIREFRG